MAKKTVPELRQDRAEVVRKAHEIWHRHDGKDTEHSAEELAEFDRLMARADELDGEIRTAEEGERQSRERQARASRIDALEANLRESAGRVSDPLPHNDPNNTRNGRHAYSLLKAIRQMDPANKGEMLDGIELEVHQELAKRYAGSSGHKTRGFFMPWDLPVDLSRARSFARANGLEARDLTTTTGAGAVMEVTSSSMIEILRNRMLMRALGARVLSDMQGNFSLPKQTGTGTAYWINPESASLTESSPAIGSVDFSPSTLGAYTDYSRNFMHQASIDAEMFVRDDLASVIAIELDRVGFNGSGSGAEPEGIIPNSDVNVVPLGTNGAAPTWANVVAMEAALDVDNALNGTINFVTTPAGRGKLKTVEKATGTAQFIWNDDNRVNGYPAFSSNQLPADLTKGTGTALSAAILGDFSQAIYALWGGLDVLVDPYTAGTSGAIRIIMMQDADFQLRHPEAFAVIKDMVTT